MATRMKDLEKRAQNGGALEPVAPAPVTLFRTDNPREVVSRATETANALAAVVKDKKLTTAIQGREHVRVEGWTLLGTMLGVFPICVWTRKLDNGWEARVEARTLNGDVVGAAEAQCLRAEANWGSRDDFALRSMAQTRATSKALRQPLGFVMTLAGFEATPAEEMTDGATLGNTTDTSKPTAPQKKKVHALLSKLEKAGAFTKDQAGEAMASQYGTEKLDEFTRAQISDLIERLEAKEKTLAL